MNLNADKDQTRPQFGDKLMFIDQERPNNKRVYKPVGFPECELDLRSEADLPPNVRPKCLIGVV